MNLIKSKLFRLGAFVLALATIAGCSSSAPSWCPFAPSKNYTDTSAIVTSSYSEPTNIYNAKQDVKAYYSSGGYDQAMNQVGEKAISHLKSCQNTPGKLAIVMDIDETSVSNYPVELQMDFGYNNDIFNKFISSNNETVIASTLALFKQAQTQGVATIFITGRPENQRDDTERNLKRLGYSNWTKLILKPNDFPKGGSAADFKAPERAKLEKEGYRIILNIGDQYSDLNGGYADRSFKYPNPFYYLP
ncbi:MAG: HAD family acid phosphatase [Lentisphaerota bacterium]